VVKRSKATVHRAGKSKGGQPAEKGRFPTFVEKPEKEPNTRRSKNVGPKGLVEKRRITRTRDVRPRKTALRAEELGPQQEK